MNDLGSTHIVDFPTEVLSQIFLNLTDNSDRLRVRDVCSRWRSVVDTTVGVLKCVGDESVWEDGRQMEPLTVLGTTGISDCTFGNIFSTQRTETWPQYLHPHLMKSVTFDGVISRAMYTNLTNPLQNLTSLTFHISTLAQIEVELQKSALSQTITSLSLTNAGTQSLRSAMTHGSEKTVFKNFCSICDTDFPKLSHFDVTLPCMLIGAWGFDLFSQLKNFLWIRRPQNLETLNFCLQNLWLLESDSYTDPNERSEEWVDAFRACLGRKGSFEMLRLDGCELDINFVIHDLDMVCALEFPMNDDTIMDQQQFETIAFTYFGFGEERLRAMMSMSWATLTEVRITTNLETRSDTVNFNGFSACTVLKTLIVEDKTEDSTGYGDPTIQSVSSLPLTLKTLELRNLLMDTPSVDYVSKSLRLETLVLDGIGSKDNHGMSIPCLLWILKESPTITALQIKGLNDSCQWTSFSWLNLIWPFTCKVCKVPHQTGFWKAGITSTSAGDSGILGEKDKELLNSLFETTIRPSIPLIQKRKDGVWDVAVEIK